MHEWLDTLAAQLEHYTRDEMVALVGDFLAELDETQQRRFLQLMTEGPRPVIAEQMDLGEGEDLLDAIQSLHDAIADDHYVEDGVGYDPAYGEHHGFGDDSWIEEMDDLFAATTSLFRAGQFQRAVAAYTALFRIFELDQDGFHFTRPDPATALRTDLDAMKQHLFIALARSEPQSAARAIELSSELRYYGTNRYSLLDAWEGREELSTALLAELLEQARQPVPLHPAVYMVSHSADLLREYYRRHCMLADYETLCRLVGPQHGWPYEDLITRYRELANWDKVLEWAEDGLDRKVAQKRYRLMLQEARGEALLQLDRPAEALETLRELFAAVRSAPVFLKLREAGRASGQWESLWPELATELRTFVVSESVGMSHADGFVSYGGGVVSVAALLGFAYMLEGEWSDAVEMAVDPAIPIGSTDENLQRIVATGLLKMVGFVRGTELDGVLAAELSNAPKLIREYGELLEPVARSLPADLLLTATIRPYERLVDYGIEGRSRPAYAVAATACKAIQSIRRMQGREIEFEQYYRALLATYTRFAALKDELRSAIEGPGYKRKR